ncbi:MAG: ANTAR domain-containing protein [Pseudomonadota bacterium]
MLVLDHADDGAAIKAGLGAGASITAVIAGDPSETAAQSVAASPDVLVISRAMSGPGLVTLISAIVAAQALPIVVFVQRADSDDARAAVRAGASAFIVDGLSPGRVRPVIDVAIERFRITSGLQEELQKSRDDLAARKTIERAKGLLMERKGLAEQEAYDAMRRMAMAQGKPLREIAATILSISDLLP